MADPNVEVCGKRHPDRPYTCELPAGHDVCMSWQSGAGVDGWTVDYGQVFADGYRKAIADLAGVADRTGHPAARWAAGYLSDIDQSSTRRETR